VVFTPQGDRVASASEDRTVRVWDTRTGQGVVTLPGHAGAVTAVAFSPDGQRIASACEDGSVRVWDAATGQEALTLRRQLVYAFGVFFSPDGERLVASGSGRGEVFRVWEAKDASQDSQTARAEVLKTDAQQVGYMRGRVHSRLGQWDKAVAAYSEAIDLGLRDAPIWSERGTAYAILEQYESAAADFARAVEAKPDEVYFWYYQAVAKLATDDLDGYRRVCAGVRERFGKTKDPARAGRLLWTCEMVVEPGTSTAELVQWGKLATASNEYVRVLGHALYRDGQYEAAVRHLQARAKIEPSRGDDLLFLAMAQHRLRKEDEAHATFAQAVAWIANSERVLAAGGVWSWYERVWIRHLRKETEALLQDQ